MSRLSLRERDTTYDKQKSFRMQDPSNGMYLHLTGKGATKGTDYAWLGFKYQAKTLIERARLRGEDFPFKIVDA